MTAYLFREILAMKMNEPQLHTLEWINLRSKTWNERLRD